MLPERARRVRVYAALSHQQQHKATHSWILEAEWASERALYSETAGVVVIMQYPGNWFVIDAASCLVIFAWVISAKKKSFIQITNYLLISIDIF